MQVGHHLQEDATSEASFVLVILVNLCIQTKPTPNCIIAAKSCVYMRKASLTERLISFCVTGMLWSQQKLVLLFDKIILLKSETLTFRCWDWQVADAHKTTRYMLWHRKQKTALCPPGRHCEKTSQALVNYPSILPCPSFFLKENMSCCFLWKRGEQGSRLVLCILHAGNPAFRAVDREVTLLHQ